MEMEPISRLSKDLKAATVTLSAAEARYLVDAYYMMQRDRIRSDNQTRALGVANEPHAVLSWLASNANILEGNIRRALDAFSDRDIVGRWSKGIVGIGPVIAAGLSAHIDLEPWRCAVAREKPGTKPCRPDEPHGPRCAREKLSTVGHIWRFGGYDPTVIWSKGERRPWNASLKTLFWKCGESFVKVSNHEQDVYGHLWSQRKAVETARNMAGEYAAQAAAKLEKFNIGKDTDARTWYEGRLTTAQAQEIFASPAEKRMGLAKKLAGKPGSGVAMLPPAHIHARAKRYAVKLFLAHWHAVAYRERYGEDAPKPYVLTHLEGHAHEIRCPNWPF